MKEKVLKILENFKKDYKKVESLEDYEELKKNYTGKDSEPVKLLKNLKDEEDIEARQQIGKALNELRQHINLNLNRLKDKMVEEKLAKQLENERIDVSLTKVNTNFGTKHPLNLVLDQISKIFIEVGFQMVDGTEVDQDLYNFQKLNLPKDHPARDMQDTFYIKDDEVLRTHATNMTAHLLTRLAKEKQDHLGAVSFGNVYRRDDDDATHSHQFMQIDGFLVGEDISFANLKWLLTYMLRRLFDDEVSVRLRPSYFPFTEPSVEVDMSCVQCHGTGCDLCKQTGWIEVLGAGMINDQVLEENGLDPAKISGFAFGVGIERIAMLKFGITNIRDFYENDIEFLSQFKFYGE